MSLAGAPATLHRLGDQTHRAIEPLCLQLDFLSKDAELVLVEVSELDRRNPAGIDALTFAHMKIVSRPRAVVKKLAFRRAER